MEQLYLKNTNNEGLIYIKINPVYSSEDEFIFEGLEITTEKGGWEMEECELSREDLEKMYDEGFITIDQDEYEKIFAIGRLNRKKQTN